MWTYGGPGGTEGLNADSGSFFMGTAQQEGYCEEATPVTSMRMDEVNEGQGSLATVWILLPNWTEGSHLSSIWLTSKGSYGVRMRPSCSAYADSSQPHAGLG